MYVLDNTGYIANSIRMMTCLTEYSNNYTETLIIIVMYALIFEDITAIGH